jgi:hypothetical protein
MLYAQDTSYQPGTGGTALEDVDLSDPVNARGEGGGFGEFLLEWYFCLLNSYGTSGRHSNDSGGGGSCGNACAYCFCCCSGDC